jgi:hypothetical protein
VTVRIVRQPAMGEVGQVVTLHNSVTLPNGLRVRAAEILLENGQTQIVPAANLEILV